MSEKRLAGKGESAVVIEQEQGAGTGMVVLSFLAGAALGAGVALFVAQKAEQTIDDAYGEADLFV